ncbi:cadherin-like beta sandwich domain-containing protein [Paenibacillus sp. y28]|uniref:cadherin-like beta sandwich domain-containing protein n=1 Tax=Paenibacillus sp. y28 TaxID=3129110 RepID=UPI0030192BD1
MLRILNSSHRLLLQAGMALLLVAAAVGYSSAAPARAEAGNTGIQAGADASVLQGFGFSAGTLEPAFDPAIAAYTLTLPETAKELTWSPQKKNTAATIRVTDGEDRVIHSLSPLGYGKSTLKFKAAAAGGQLTTYTVTVHRPSTALSSLSFSTGVLDNRFTPDNLSYVLTVSENTDTLSWVGVLRDPSASVTATDAEGSLVSQPLPLVYGKQEVKLHVRTDGMKDRVYTAVIHRPSVLMEELQFDSGSLQTPFNPNTIDYTLTVPESTEQLNWSLRTRDPAASVTVTDQGGQPAAMPLEVPYGEQRLNFTIRSNGHLAQAYTVTVRRPSTSLVDLGFSGGTLQPEYSPETLSYLLTLPEDAGTLDWAPVKLDPTAALRITDHEGKTLIASNMKPGYGEQQLRLQVATAGLPSQAYTVTVRRPSAALAKVTFSSGSLDSRFDPEVYKYRLTLPESVEALSWELEQRDPTAAVAVTDQNGEPISSPVQLAYGEQQVNFTVSTEGRESRVYTFIVHRPSAALTNISFDTGEWSTVFSPGTTSYTLTTAEQTETLGWSVVQRDSAATVAVIHHQNEKVSSPVPVEFGNQTLLFRVSSAGLNDIVYSVKVHRPSVEVKDFGFSDGTLEPIEGSGGLSYLLALPETADKLSWAPVLLDPAASVAVLDERNQPVSSPLPVQYGNQTLKWKVVSDGLAAKTYTVTVRRPSVSVTGFGFSGGKLDDLFKPDTVSYTLNVPEGTGSLSWAPVLKDPTAQLEVTDEQGQPLTGPVEVAFGQRILKFTISSPGLEAKEYTVKVHRASAALTGLGNSAGSLTTTFAPATLDYMLIVPAGTDTLSWAPVTRDPTARSR